MRDARSRARPAGPPSPPLPSHYVRAPRQVFFFARPVDRSSIPHPPLAPDPSPSPAFAAPARPDPPARQQWEDTENKSAVVTYVAGAAALVWLSGTVVGAINSIPVLPKVMELVGLGYSSWFVYRYVLFKDSRKELVEQFDALKNKVSGEL